MTSFLLDQLPNKAVPLQMDHSSRRNTGSTFQGWARHAAGILNIYIKFNSLHWQPKMTLSLPISGYFSLTCDVCPPTPSYISVPPKPHPGNKTDTY